MAGNVLKRGNTWYARVFVNGRDVWRAAGPTRRHAVVLAAEMQKAAAGDGLLPRRSAITFREFVEEAYLPWAEQHKRSIRRDRWCSAQLVERFGDHKLGEITRERAEALQRDWASEGKSPATVNRGLALLKRILTLAVERREIDESPVKGLRMLTEPPGRLPQLSLDEERQLLDLLAEGQRGRSDDALNDYLALIVRTLLTSGARINELLSLRWRNVDLDRGIASIERSKSGGAREIVLHPAVVAGLRLRRGLADGFVYLDPRGKVPTSNHVSVRFKAAARKIGRGELRLHDLRHVCASRLVSAGASLPEVASQLGHKTLIVANRYVHASRERMQSLVAALPVVEGKTK